MSVSLKNGPVKGLGGIIGCLYRIGSFSYLFLSFREIGFSS
jgi:hypothetical protein